jgi:uncharacterized protein
MANAPFDTILIKRPVLSVAPILHAAARMGVTISDPAKLHITLACSRTPVNWCHPVFLEDPSFLWLAPQTMAVVRFHHAAGEVVALKVSSLALEDRHTALRAAGASWDHSSYQPHITLGPVPAHELPEAITFREVIELGLETRKVMVF